MATVVPPEAGKADDDGSDSGTLHESEVLGPVYSDRMKTKTIMCSITAPHEAGHKVDAIYFKQWCDSQERLRDIVVKQDVTYEEFLDYIKTDESLRKYGSFLFVFLTYLDKENDRGGSDENLRFTNKTVSIVEIQDMIKSVKAMHGKPKILLIQADQDHLEVNKQILVLPPIEQKKHLYREIKIPTDSDMLVMMSTVPRWHIDKPSFLLQAFGEVMARNWHRVKDEQEDFLTLTIEINVRFEELFKEFATASGDTPLPMADYDPPIEVNRHADPVQPREQKKHLYKEIKIPIDSDMLVMMSTVPRYMQSKASFLLLAFGEVLARNWSRVKDEQEDFLTLTIEINVKFEELFRAVPRQSAVDTPLPMVTSTLRQLLYL